MRIIWGQIGAILDQLSLASKQSYMSLAELYMISICQSFDWMRLFRITLRKSLFEDVLGSESRTATWETYASESNKSQPPFYPCQLQEQNRDSCRGSKAFIQGYASSMVLIVVWNFDWAGSTLNAHTQELINRYLSDYDKLQISNLTLKSGFSLDLNACWERLFRTEGSLVCACSRSKTTNTSFSGPPRPDTRDTAATSLMESTQSMTTRSISTELTCINRKVLFTSPFCRQLFHAKDMMDRFGGSAYQSLFSTSNHVWGQVKWFTGLIPVLHSIPEQTMSCFSLSSPTIPLVRKVHSEQKIHSAVVRAIKNMQSGIGCRYGDLWLATKLPWFPLGSWYRLFFHVRSNIPRVISPSHHHGAVVAK